MNSVQRSFEEPEDSTERFLVRNLREAATRSIHQIACELQSQEFTKDNCVLTGYRMNTVH